MSEVQVAEVTPTKVQSMALVVAEAEGKAVAALDKKREIDPARRAEIKATLNLSDSMSLILYGSELQKETTALSDQVIANVKNKDAGVAGAVLGEFMGEVRGLSMADLNHKTGGILGMFASKAKAEAANLVGFIQKYETIDGQLNKTIDKIEETKLGLFRDIVWLDKMFDATLAKYHALGEYIQVAEDFQVECKAQLADMKMKAGAANDEDEAQKVADFENQLNDLDRKIHNLRVTKTLARQALVKVRLIQAGDKTLALNLQDDVTNMIAAWKDEISIAITQARSAAGSKMNKDMHDTMGKMIERTSESLKVTSAEIRSQNERGMVDMAALKVANDNLIATLEQAVQIADEGTKMREQAKVEFDGMSQSLQKALIHAQDAKVLQIR